MVVVVVLQVLCAVRMKRAAAEPPANDVAGKAQYNWLLHRGAAHCMLALPSPSGERVIANWPLYYPFTQMSWGILAELLQKEVRRNSSTRSSSHFLLSLGRLTMPFWLPC